MNMEFGNHESPPTDQQPLCQSVEHSNTVRHIEFGTQIKTDSGV